VTYLRMHFFFRFTFIQLPHSLHGLAVQWGQWRSLHTKRLLQIQQEKLTGNTKYQSCGAITTIWPDPDPESHLGYRTNWNQILHRFFCSNMINIFPANYFDFQQAYISYLLCLGLSFHPNQDQHKKVSQICIGIKRMEIRNIKGTISRYISDTFLQGLIEPR
jgi:hypothetical protein